MNPVEDIIINKQAPQPKKGSKLILILIFVLVILLVGSCGAFYWYANFYETPKAAFFKYLGQTNIPEITDTQIYYDILERMNKSNYETDTEANFTTTEKTDFTQNVDVSNFLLTIKTLSNKDNKEAYIGANITYKDNPFFDVEIVSTSDNIAIGSSEILDKYIATSKNSLTDSLNRTMNMDTDVTADTINEEMEKFADNRINLDEEYKKQKVTEYVTMVMEKVPEEAVTLTEDTQITMNSEVVNTKAYALKLDANSYRDVVTRVLTNLKNDTEFLEKVVTGEASEPVIEQEEVKTPKPINIEKIEGQTIEHETSQELQTNEEESIPVNLDEEEPPQEELPAEEESELDILSTPEIDLLDANQDTMFPTDFISDEENFDEEEQKPEDIFTQLIEALVFNQKLDMSVEELQNKLDEKIQNLDISADLEVTVYVRDIDDKPKETIKILANLSDTATLDIEYPENSKAKITFLDDIITVNDEGEEITKKQGSAIEIKRANTDIETSFNIVLNTIEEQKVVKKLQLDLTTKGTKTSKTYENEIIIKNSDSEGDSKVNIKNTIDFHNAKLEKTINEENSIFVDQITDEEATNLFTNVMIRLMGLYSDKILNMNFVDVTGNEENPDREIYSFGKTTADMLMLPGQTFDDPTASEEDTNNTDNEQTEVQEDPSETPPIVVTEPSNPPDQSPSQEQSQDTTQPSDNNNQQGENNNQQQNAGGDSNNNNNNQNSNADNGNNGGNNGNNNNSNNDSSNNSNNNQNTSVNSDSAVSVETITKTNIKNILLNQIEIMKNEAHNRGKEFALKDLSNLPKQIEGMNVSSIITGDKATIKMAGYTFYVDKNLMITEE